jgi:hypothetical protein
MRKLAFQVGEDIQEERPRSKVPLIFMGFFLFMGLGPLALEGASLCLSNWKEYMGIRAEVKTPVLDNFQDSVEDAREIFWNEITPYFRGLPWDPKMVLPAASLVMVGAMLLLRR